MSDEITVTITTQPVIEVSLSQSDLLTDDEFAAIHSANNPDINNPIATMNDISAVGVFSVNGESGAVILNAADVGADATGTASSAIITHVGDTQHGTTLQEQTNITTAVNHAGAAHAAINADNTALNETSHADVLVDGDIGVNVAAFSHNHSGVYELADATILKEADIDSDLSSVSENDDTVPSAKATKVALDEKLNRTEGLIEIGTAYNSSSLTTSGQIVDCTAALTLTLETYTNRGEGFQFGVIASGGEVTFAGTFDKKSTYTKLAQGDTAWVVRKSGTWHVSGLSS